jgi:hypothetical protein
MTYQKNLGKVKGDKGNIFVPNVSVTQDNKLNFSWTEQTNDTIHNVASQEVSLKVFKPVLNNNGDLTFELINVDSFDASAAESFYDNLPINIKGPDGEAGQMKLRTQTVKNDSAFFEDIKNVTYDFFPAQEDIDNSFSIDANDDVWVGDYKIREDTLYITSDHYIYVINIDQEHYTATKLEGISLDNYYTKEQTYSKSDVDTMFADATQYMALIYRLLDVDAFKNDEIDNNPNINIGD